MDNRLRNLLIFFSLAFVAIAANLTYLQFFKADELLASQYNIRSLAEELATKRGSVITADGIEIAQSERVTGKKHQRFYPAGEPFSAITGFYDSRYGRFALEQKYNDELLGKDPADTLADYIDRIAGRGEPGNDLMLTVNSKIQRVAYRSLIGHRGAVVAIEPATGAVLALASYPGYNPNTLRADWKKLLNNKKSPLLNRATSGLYPPGSSFKTVTLTAGLENKKTKAAKVYPGPPIVRIYGGKVTNYKGKNYGNVTLQEAFEQSVNTVFAKLGLEVGGPALVTQAESFGFNKDMGFDLPLKKSLVKQPGEMDSLELAWTAVGQAHTLATPMQMAMVAAAVANKGHLMQPFLVSKIRDYQGRIIDKKQPKELAVVAGGPAVREVRNLMLKVVETGTGKGAKVAGVQVAGKTGTAEVKGKEPHAWFIAFAPASKPKIAVAVIVENGGTGGARAAPIAAEVIKEALKKD